MTYMEIGNKTQKAKKGLSIFEKYLTIWVVLCIVIGIVLGKLAPGFAKTLDGIAIHVNNAPVGGFGMAADDHRGVADGFKFKHVGERLRVAGHTVDGVAALFVHRDDHRLRRRNDAAVKGLRQFDGNGLPLCILKKGGGEHEKHEQQEHDVDKRGKFREEAALVERIMELH